MKTLLIQTELRTARRRSFLLFVIIATVFQTVGCSGFSSLDTVRPDVAKETLVTALTAWQDGRMPGELKSGSPAIVVQDMDWSAGSQLSKFELQGDGRAVGANLSIEVELNLVNKAGESTQQKVWYLVGTDPALTVFRDMLH